MTTKAKRTEIDQADLDGWKVWKRFVRKVDFRGPNGCWVWRGHKNNKGYGQVRYNKVCYLAHRFAYALFRAPVPAGVSVCHTCDNRCVNPSHMFLGTQKDNMRDMIAKGRGAHQRGTHKVYRGSQNGSSRLNESQVREIKQALRFPRRGLVPELARRFGVDPRTIDFIRVGHTWSHIHID